MYIYCKRENRKKLKEGKERVLHGFLNTVILEISITSWKGTREYTEEEVTCNIALKLKRSTRPF